MSYQETIYQRSIFEKIVILTPKKPNVQVTKKIRVYNVALIGITNTISVPFFSQCVPFREASI